MVKTAIAIPNPLHQRLVQTSKVENKSVAALIRELLDTALVTKEKGRIEHSYQALDKLIGIYKDEDPYLASSVDEVLYGATDAEKGAHAQ